MGSYLDSPTDDPGALHSIGIGDAEATLKGSTVSPVDYEVCQPRLIVKNGRMSFREGQGRMVKPPSNSQDPSVVEEGAERPELTNLAN